MNQGFESAIVQKGRLLPGIHGLRGLAALAVVLYHLNHLVDIIPPDSFDFIGRYFGYSVHLFFILSAFSLMYSSESRINHPNWLPEYFLKRFFRIAPLYYCMIALVLTRQIVFSGRIDSDIIYIPLNLTFTFGFVPFTELVWGGWAVGVEMIFYFIFPVLLLTIRTHRSALTLLIVSIMLSYFIRSALHTQYLTVTPQPKWDWSYFAFASNMCFFAMGIYAFHLGHIVEKSILLNRIVPLLTLIIIGGLLFFNVGKYFYGSGRLDIVLWGLGFMLLCTWQSVSPSLVIANRFFEYLGERSFSIYLLHPVVIMVSQKVSLFTIYDICQPYIGLYAFFVCAILITALVMVFAECTYRLIELPGIRFGRKIMTHWKYA
jgi:peptidoglycan/LPS O-acetylase OafA/YrhL